MTRNDELMKAIGAHGRWKMRLRNAIESAELDQSIDVIKADSQCDFGKWLISVKTTNAGEEQHLKAVSKLHAEFHSVAGKAAELIKAGKGSEASKMLADNGPFAVASSKLTEAIMAWKAS